MVVVLPLGIWHSILQLAVYAPHYLEDALNNSPLVERNANSAMSTTITETEATLSRLALVNKSFQTLASGLKYQHLIFREQSDLQVLVHSINTNPDIHADLRNHARTMTVLFPLGKDKAAYDVNLGRLTTVLLLTPHLTVIELCESNAHEWRSAERASAVEYWFAQVASLAPSTTAVKFGLDWSHPAPPHIADWCFLAAVSARYTHLRYLHCNIACNQSLTPFRPPFEPVVFPNLESLVTCIAEYQVSSEDKVEYLTEWVEQWQLPTLKHLAINGRIEYHDWSWIVRLLTNNGGRLETLLVEVSLTCRAAPQSLLISSGSHLARNESHPRPGSVLASVPKIMPCNGGRVPYPTTKRERKELNRACFRVVSIHLLVGI